MNKLYNEEIKERFLSTYDNEQTQKTIRNVFFKTELIESVLDKDVYEFTLEQLNTAITNTNPHSKSVATSTGRFLSQYISFCIENGYRKGNINPLKSVNDEFYENTIDKTKKIHYSYDEFLELLNDPNLLNNSDKAMLALMFEGIIGEKFSQIRELKYSDIDFDNNTVYVKERDEHLKINEQFMQYLEKACNKTTYFQYNSNTQEFVEKPLLESGYIFKTVKSPRGVENEPVKLNVFYSRIHTIKELLEREYLTPNALKQSGMIKMAVDIYKQVGKLAYDELAQVGERYQFSTITNNGYTYINTFLLKEFLNETTIKELYGLDVEIEKR